LMSLILWLVRNERERKKKEEKKRKT